MQRDMKISWVWHLKTISKQSWLPITTILHCLPSSHPFLYVLLIACERRPAILIRSMLGFFVSDTSRWQTGVGRSSSGSNYGQQGCRPGAVYTSGCTYCTFGNNLEAEHTNLKIPPVMGPIYLKKKELLSQHIHPKFDGIFKVKQLH